MRQCSLRRAARLSARDHLSGSRHNTLRLPPGGERAARAVHGGRACRSHAAEWGQALLFALQRAGRDAPLCDRREEGVAEPRRVAYLHETLRVGAEIEIGAPRNNFPLIESAPHSVLIAGGIGITPILSMIQRLGALGASFELHYACRTRGDAAFFNDFDASTPIRCACGLLSITSRAADARSSRRSSRRRRQMRISTPAGPRRCSKLSSARPRRRPRARAIWSGSRAGEGARATGARFDVLLARSKPSHVAAGQVDPRRAARRRRRRGVFLHGWRLRLLQGRRARWRS